MREFEIDEITKEEDRLGEILAYLEKTSKRDEEKKEEHGEKKYVTLIYFFSSLNKPGIRMVDCSSQGVLSKFTGTTGIDENTLSKKTGTFITKQTSPVYVDWDNELNEVNKATYVKRPIRNDDAIYIIYTFIVSEAELKNIENQINMEKANNDGLIHIKVDNLYDFNLEYSFYRELNVKNKLSSKKYENINVIVPKENINDEISKENKIIKSIENEENKIDNSLYNVKNSKKSLIDFKNFINRFFPKNKINNEENSNGGFNI